MRITTAADLAEAIAPPALTQEQLGALAAASARVGAEARCLADLDAEERLGPVASGGLRRAGLDLVDGFAEGVVAGSRSR